MVHVTNTTDRSVLHRFTMLLLCIAACLLATPTSAQVVYPDRIGDREFILDNAGLIETADAETIVAICDTLLTERKIPIIVVTIPSLDGQNARGWTIERYAHNLFDEWRIGYPDYNYGILLLIAKSDRRARIELGADYGREFDDVAQSVMDDLIVPRFKRGAFSRGITDGVAALDKMARGEKTPTLPVSERLTTAWDRVMQFFRNLGGTCVWLIVLPIVLLGRLLGILPEGGDDDSGFGSWGGGSFGGGSFGGGFSGGGGASGSW